MEIAGADQYQCENTVLCRNERILFIGIVAREMRYYAWRPDGMAKKLLAKGRTGSYSRVINAENGTRAVISLAATHYVDGSVWMAD